MLHSGGPEGDGARKEGAVTIKNQKDFWAGLMFIAFGLAFVVIALGSPGLLDRLYGDRLIPGYQMGSAVRMGPAYFPVVLGGILAILGLIVFVRSFASKLRGDAAAVHMSFGIVDFAVAAAIFAVLGWASKKLWDNADYGMLAAALVLSVLAFLLRPSARPLVLIFASCLVFAYLVKPLGVVLASILLVFVGALGGHEFKFREVTILAVALAIFSVFVFVKGLTLPFPIWPAFWE